MRTSLLLLSVFIGVQLGLVPPAAAQTSYPMITHTMPLEDINKAFDLMHEGKSIRSVILF